MVLGYPRRAVAVDAALLGGIAALLVGLHAFLSPTAKAVLTFDHAAVQPHALLTAAYVHVGAIHLLGNVGGFLAAAGMAYLLCLALDRRGWFHVTLPWLLVAIPPIANAASLLATLAWYPAVPISSRGFSAVVAGTGGFVFVGLVAVLARDRGRDVAVFAGSFVVVLLLAIAYVRSVDALAAPVVIALLGGLLVTGAGAAFANDTGRAHERTRTHLRGRAIPLLLIVALLGSLVAGLFPTDPVQGGYRTDVVAHGVGFLAGAAFAAVTARW